MDINGYHVIYHNYGIGMSGRCYIYRRVAIALSPTTFYQARKDARSQPPITIDIDGEFDAIFIGLTLKFQSYDSNEKNLNRKFYRLFLVSE